VQKKLKKKQDINLIQVDIKTKNISSKKSTPKKELHRKSVHTKSEIISYSLKNISKYLMIFSISIVSLIFLIFVFLQFFTKSYYIEKIPKNTQKFVHINLYSDKISILKEVFKIFKSDLTVDDFILAKDIDVPYLTLLEDEKNNSIFFLEKISRTDVERLLKNFSTPNEKIEFKKENGTKMITLKSGRQISCIYEGKTLYCSKNKESLEVFTQDEFPNNENLKKEIQNLPKNTDITWFIDSNNLKTPFLKAHKTALERLYGTLQFSEGNKMISRIYAITKKDFSSSDEKKKLDSLASKFPKENILFFLGGQNFENQWLHTEEFYKNNSPEYALILKGILMKKVSNLFGDEIDFYKDILSIFKETYAFGISKDSENKMQFSFISKGNDSKKIENILDVFFKNRGIFTVEKKEFKVDDNTILQSVYSNEDKIKEVNERVGATRILGYEIKDYPWGIFTAQKGDLIYISTSKESLSDLLKNKKESIDKNFSYKLKNAHEFGFISLSELQNLFSFIPFEAPKFAIFDSMKNISWESESHSGGMSVYAEIDL